MNGPSPDRSPDLAPAPRPPADPPGRQLLGYTPDGPLGGTFTCTRCGAQAWQPDLLDHAPGCPYRPNSLDGRGAVPHR